MAWAFCSGMAAETALFLTHGREGIVCIGDAYGGTLELLTSQLPLLGIRTHLILGSELERLDELLAGSAKLVFFETPTNPTLELLDIRAICTKAHAHGAKVVVDNTFASPVNQRPLELGADFVVHSATKYLGGHSDLTAGALMGAKELLMPVWNWRKNLGSMISRKSRRFFHAVCAPWWSGFDSKTSVPRLWPKPWPSTPGLPAFITPVCPTFPVMRWRRNRCTALAA
jgi:cystathionine gamma-synthase